MESVPISRSSSPEDGHGEAERLHAVPPLTDLCVEAIRRKLIGTVETVDVLFIANLLRLKQLREDCLASIRFKYAFFKEATDEEYLRELCGEEEIAKMERDLAQTNEFKRYISQKGTALDNAVTDYSQQSAYEPSDAPGEPMRKVYFPVEALVMGIQWPKGIDPSKREDWLSDEEFERVFKITRDQFNSLPRFKKLELKKAMKLW